MNTIEKKPKNSLNFYVSKTEKDISIFMTPLFSIEEVRKEIMENNPEERVLTLFSFTIDELGEAFHAIKYIAATKDGATALEKILTKVFEKGLGYPKFG